MSFFCVVSSSGEEKQVRLRQMMQESNGQEGKDSLCLNDAHGIFSKGDGSPSNRETPVIGGSGGICKTQYNQPSMVVKEPEERYRSEIRLSTGPMQQDPQSSSMHWNNDYNPSDSANLRRKLQELTATSNGNQRRKEFSRSKEVYGRLSQSTTGNSELDVVHGGKAFPFSDPIAFEQSTGATEQALREGRHPSLHPAARNNQKMKGDTLKKTSDSNKVGQLRHRWEILTTNDPLPKQQVTAATPSGRGYGDVPRRRLASDEQKQERPVLPPKTKPKPKKNVRERSEAFIECNQPPPRGAQDGGVSSVSNQQRKMEVNPVEQRLNLHKVYKKREDSGLSSACSTISLENFPVHNYSHNLPPNASDRRVNYASKKCNQLPNVDSKTQDALPRPKTQVAFSDVNTSHSTLKPEVVQKQQRLEEEQFQPDEIIHENYSRGYISSHKHFHPEQIIEENISSEEFSSVKKEDQFGASHLNVNSRNDLHCEREIPKDQNSNECERLNSSAALKTEIFFRPGALVQLEDKRDRQLSDTITRFQAHCRGFLARENVKQLKVQKLAITCIQRNVRKFLAVKNWPWWRLVTKVLPLLDVHRTEEELKMKDLELEQLRVKVAKMETERNTLKQNVDKLDSRVTEMTADLSEEHTAATHASEMLEVETAERLRLEKELKEIRSNYNALQRKSEKMEMELMEHRMVRSSIIEADMSSDDETDSMYRLKYMQLRKEMELGKKRLQQDHEEELEKLISNRKSVEKKFLEASEEAEEYKRQLNNFKRRSQKLAEESQDMKLHLESQQTRNSDLEKKQRKFDAELAKVHQDLQHEKTAKDRLQREKGKLEGENYIISQQLEDLKLDMKVKEEKIDVLKSEMDDLSSHGSMEVKELTGLKRAKRDLETKLQDQEEELDDQAGQIQQLEQTKLRLEMQLERVKQSHQKELDAKDEEVEEVRASAQNKVKQMEIQLEEDYEERQSVMREKRELERRVQELLDKPLASDKDTEKRLRKDLKKTKALLKDAQTMLDRQNSAAPSGTKLKQLKNELEDATFATASAVKARQNLETELSELQAQLDDMMKAKSDAEERLSVANRDKTELESKLEDQEEDFNDLLKKHRALIHQMSNEQAKVNEHLETIADLTNEKQELQEKVSELQGKVDFLSESMVDRTQVNRLESKVRELEAKLDLEHTTKNKLENQVERLRDSLDRSNSDHSSVQQKELRSQEASRKLQREIRELREEQSELQRKESEATQKKHELELEVESLQASHDQVQSDLKLAFKRIADLQRAVEDGIGSDSDSCTPGSDSDDSDSSGDEYLPRYSQYSSNRSSRLSSLSSVDSSQYTTRRTRVYSSTSEKSDDVRRRSRSGKYVINPGSSDEDEDVDELGARSTSRPSSMYSEDTVGSVELGENNVSLTSSSTIGGESGDGTKKKGFMINPDYM
ncbi:unconventional myosin-XVIIIa-like isoform X2 [Lytechinus variegatus]|uniref:unconventional myosin-XVIIIa-like isoform X2 n=1 Tax=Lytechinus variegatus TaxID=7654 RepID=UPI001BB2102E|nr:unconventional myosin-XVIIIa-like isoform X2 [Lytechinus variegatus]